LTTRSAGLGLALVLVASACGGMSTAPSATPATPVATEAPATPAPTAEPATAAPPPTSTPASTLTPDPDQVAAGDALEAFSALARDEALTYRMEQTGSFTASTGGADFAYSIDVAGFDFSAILTVSGETTELRGVGDTLYEKGTDGEWTSDALDPALTADIVDPWQYLGSLDELIFLSRAPQRMEAFQFANSGPVVYQTAQMRATGVKGEITMLNFIVMPDGVPVELMFAAETPDGQGGMVKISSVVAFSNVGEAITVQKPAP
jgi:hypothetical protein